MNSQEAGEELGEGDGFDPVDEGTERSSRLLSPSPPSRRSRALVGDVASRRRKWRALNRRIPSRRSSASALDFFPATCVRVTLRGRTWRSLAITRKAR